MLSTCLRSISDWARSRARVFCAASFSNLILSCSVTFVIRIVRQPTVTFVIRVMSVNTVGIIVRCGVRFSDRIGFRYWAGTRLLEGFFFVFEVSLLVFPLRLLALLLLECLPQLILGPFHAEEKS